MKTDVFKEYSFESVMAAAEAFLGGRTDYETPLTEALRLIGDGFQNADIVFITDGECAVSEQFSDSFREAKAERKFTVTGLLMDKGSPGFAFSLTPFCEKVYRTSELVDDEIARAVIGGRI